MKKDEAKDAEATAEKPICGIIMPISECTNKGVTYSAAHWESMKLFLEDAIRESGYEPKAVWEGIEQSVIHSRIVNNIADFPLMICVICGSNVNVMIELGLRLMTDKPVLVIYEEGTQPPFDVNVLQMFGMPINPDYKDYQYLKEQIKEVLPKMMEQGYKTFLSNFKQITPKGVSGTEKVELAQFMNATKESIQDLQTQVSMLISQNENVNRQLPRRRMYVDEQLLQQSNERIEKDLWRRRLEDRLVGLRMSLDSMLKESNISPRLLNRAMDELSSIERDCHRHGWDDSIPIGREIMQVREMIDSAMRRNR